jgi:TRAP transporter TAXI family solute receptor
VTTGDAESPPRSPRNGWRPDGLEPGSWPDPVTGDVGSGPSPSELPSPAELPSPSGLEQTDARVSSRRRFLLGALVVAVGGGSVAVLSKFSGPPLPAHLNLATGPRGAVYIEVGKDLADAVRGVSSGTQVSLQMTGATVENLRRLVLGTSDLGFASLDAAAVDSQVRTHVIRALGRVYDSCLHLVVPKESPIRSLRDITGSRVCVGALASGTEFTSLGLMGSAGVQPAQVVRLGQARAMKALEEGNLDASFSLTGYPTPAIAALAKRRAIRLVPLGEYFGALDRSIPQAYAPAPIPAGVYQGVDATDTVLVPNVLLARPGLSDVTVALVMNALYGDSSKRHWKHAESKQISWRMATVTGPVLLHPAAQRWLEGRRP